MCFFLNWKRRNSGLPITHTGSYVVLKVQIVLITSVGFSTHRVAFSRVRIFVCIGANFR